jgi:hypothetical protein
VLKYNSSLVRIFKSGYMKGDIDISSTLTPQISLTGIFESSMRQRRVQSDSAIGVLVGALLSSVVLGIVALSLGALRLPLPGAASPSATNWSLFGVGNAQGKNAFLADMERVSNHEITKQVHFLSDLISSLHRGSKAPKMLAFSIVRQSKRANYDPILVAAVIKAESTFRQRAVSHVGALGLMQIMPATGEYISSKERIRWNGTGRLLDDSDYNIQLGIAYLQYLERMFNGDMEKVLIAYNWGPGNLIQAMREGRRPPSQCIKYARTILADHRAWSKQYYDRQDQYRYLPVAYLSDLNTQNGRT